MHTKVLAILLSGLFLFPIALSACSAQAANTNGSNETAATKPSQQNVINGDVERSYHTVLMVERAADLMIAVIDKQQSGQIAPGDTAAMNPYLDAFAAAMEDYNRTTPPQGILNHPWQTASRATIQIGTVYSALIQGKTISANDQVSLRSMRQLLTNYQNIAEGYLTSWGLGVPAFFASQRLAVEMHLQKIYGDLPLPPSTN